MSPSSCCLYLSCCFIAAVCVFICLISTFVSSDDGVSVKLSHTASLLLQQQNSFRSCCSVVITLFQHMDQSIRVKQKKKKVFAHVIALIGWRSVKLCPEVFPLSSLKKQTLQTFSSRDPAALHMTEIIHEKSFYMKVLYPHISNNVLTTTHMHGGHTRHSA